MRSELSRVELHHLHRVVQSLSSSSALTVVAADAIAEVGRGRVRFGSAEFSPVGPGEVHVYNDWASLWLSRRANAFRSLDGIDGATWVRDYGKVLATQVVARVPAVLVRPVVEAAARYIPVRFPHVGLVTALWAVPRVIEWRGNRPVYRAVDGKLLV